MRLKQLPSFAKIIAPEICRVLCGDLTMSHKRLNGLFYSSRKNVYEWFWGFIQWNFHFNFI